MTTRHGRRAPSKSVEYFEADHIHVLSDGTGYLRKRSTSLGSAAKGCIFRIGLFLPTAALILTVLYHTLKHSTEGDHINTSSYVAADE